jgi:hypothetical protein
MEPRRRDRILLSDAVVAALVSAGAAAEMIEAAQSAARAEYEACRVKERPKEAAWKRRRRAAISPLQRSNPSSRDTNMSSPDKCPASDVSRPDIDLSSRDTGSSAPVRGNWAERRHALEASPHGGAVEYRP